ncbi:MAG: type IV secretion system protein, partial [Patescibacteria group bacterium]
SFDQYLYDAPGWEKTLDISTTLISGFHPSKLLARDANAPRPPVSELADTLLNIIIAEIFAIVLIVVVSVVLMAAMAMLITRIVVLWFVLILAPLAFLFWVLPRTSSYTDEWFSTLFKHAFFYPAFMFTLYISITAIKYNVVAKMINADKDGLAGAMFSNSQFAAGGASFFTQKIQLILNFVILTMLMAGGLLVAQKMGVQGASAATSASKYLSGKGKSIGNRTLYGGYAFAGGVSEKVSNTAVGRAIARVPIARQALRIPGAAIQKRNEERAKIADQQAARVKGLAPQAAAGMLSTLNARGRAKAFETLSEKQKAETVQQMNSSQQIAFAKSIHSTDPNKDYARQVAIASGSVEQAMKILNPEITRPDSIDPNGKDKVAIKAYQDNVEKYLRGLSDADKAKLRAESVDDIYFKRAAAKGLIDTEKLQDSRDLVDPEARKAFESLTKEINSVTGAVKILTGLDAPPPPPPPPQPPQKPPENATGMEKLAYEEAKIKYEKDYEKNMAEYNKVNAPAIEKYDKYREEMSEYTAKYVPEKKLEKISKDTIRDNTAFQDMMIEEMTGADIRRMAKDREGAAALKDAFRSYASRKFNLDIDKDWDKVAAKIGADGEGNGNNQAMAKWMQENMGAKAIIQQGRAASRRDLPMGTPTTPSPSGNSNQINPTPPAPPPGPVSGTGKA